MSAFLDRISSMSPKRLSLLAMELQSRLEAIEQQQHEPIAIIGMSCRMPGADNLDDFWALLRDGVDAITEVPAERWPVDAFYDPDQEAPGKMYSRYGGFLQNIDQFDPHFFGVAPREAVGMDPQQRLLLEVTWEALEHAGQAPESLAGSKTGVFIGVFGADYFHLQLNNGHKAIDAYLASGTAHSIASGRISYILGLQGPSLSVDTACSSSLVAIHLAVESLRRGECSAALAGGANLILSPETTIALSRARMMAPDGRCKTFDASADGYVRGEGCGVIVLKRLSDAQANGDRVLAVIRGTAINQDGRSNGLTAPNGPSQESVIRDALDDARVTPGEIGYIEAHGTGTSLGDPIEVQALGAVLGSDHSSTKPLWLGSVKTNIGHLEAAAGVAGVIKTVLALQHRQIPPHLHFQEPNPYIPWDRLPVAVPRSLVAWDAPDGQRLAGVSSFGFSGTNVHMILGEAPEVPEPAADSDQTERPLHLLALSATNENAFRELVTRYTAFLPGRSDPADIAFTSNAGRSHFSHRLAITGATAAEFEQRLRAFASGAEVSGVVNGQVVGHRTPRTAFLFTGQGATVAGKGRLLYETQPTFRSALDECDTLLQDTMNGASIIDILFNGDDRLRKATFFQPALFALEYALARMWMSWGIMPDAVMGHSLGEYVAACVAGVFSLEDGLKIVAERGRLMDTLPAGGAMAAIFADEAAVAEAIRPYRATVSIAAINGPQNVVISGASDAVDTIIENGAFRARRLSVSHAFHSPLMDSIIPEFTRAAEAITYHAPSIPLIANLTGGEVQQAAYWRDHLRQPVQFAASMQALHERGVRVFLEIGPAPTLVSMGQRCLPEDYGLWLPSLRDHHDDWSVLLGSLSEMYVHGVPVDWTGFDGDYTRQRIEAPTYPFQRQRCWIEVSTPATPVDSVPMTLEADSLFHEVIWAGLDRGFSAVELAEAIDRLMADVPAISEAAGLEPYNTLQPGLNAMCAAYIVQGFAQLGHNFQVGQQLTVPDLMDRYGIQDRHARLMGRLLDTLAEDGWLVRDGLQWTVAEVPTAADPDAMQSDLMQAYPDFDAELTLTARCARSLVDVLRGHTDPLDLLFPEGSLADTEKLYEQSPSSRTYNTLIQEAVAARAAAVPEGGTLHILEIGAGTGGTTSYVLPVLDPDQTTYTFTDISPLFTQQARAKFADYPFMQYAPLNIETDPAQQGFEPNSCDVIIAANVVHATSDLRTTLGHIRQLLRDGGLLILLEATAPSRFGDLTVGLTEGWWAFTDTDLRPDYALLSTPRWLDLLAETGFVTAHAVPGPEAPGVLAQQAMFVALNPAHEATEAARWLILDDGNLGGTLAGQIAARGHTVDCVSDNINIPIPDEITYHGIIDLRALRSSFDTGMALDTLQQAQQQLVGGLLTLVQQTVHRDQAKPPRLWLVTRGGQPVAGGSAQVVDTDAIQASIWGMSHVIDMEHPELNCTRLDLDPDADDQTHIKHLVDELLRDDPLETEIAYRGGKRLGRRLVPMPSVSAPPVRFRPDASYLITGGLTGLGLLVAEWMAERGAGHLVLMGRRPPSPEAEAVITRLRGQGVDVVVAQGDVSSPEDVQHAIAAGQSDDTPLRGVIHAAGTLDDGTLMMQNWARFETVMKAKVYGTWNLHQLTHDLDFMVLFSSGASLMGSAGQSNHAAANAFMDGLAYHRSLNGLPTITLNWGAWSGVGAAVDRQLDEHLDTIAPRDGLLALERALHQGLHDPRPQIALLPVNWGRLVTETPTFARRPLLAHVVRSLQADGRLTAQPQQQVAPEHDVAATFLDDLAAALPSARVSLVRTQVRAYVAQVLGLDPTYPIKLQQPLFELGLDSLMAVDLRNMLGKLVGQTLPSTIVFDYPTIETLADFLLTFVSSDTLQTTEPDAADELDSLSDDELASLLASKLDRLNDDE